MREEVSLLFATVRQWSRLKADVLLYDGGALPDEHIPLERRVLGLLRATRALCTEEPRSTLCMVLPATTHPLCLNWLSMNDLQRQIRRMAAGTAELEWLEEDPVRWTQLCESVVWQEAPFLLEKSLNRTLRDLRTNPLTANVPPVLALEYLVQAVLDTPPSMELRLRTLDLPALRRVLTGGGERLVAWAEERGEARRLIRRQALDRAVEHALFSTTKHTAVQPNRTPVWPSQHLHPCGGSVPFQGHWAQESALLMWCAAPEERACRALVGPPGSGRYALAHELCTHLQEVGWATARLTEEVPPDTASDLLVVVDDAWSDAEAVRSLMATPRAGRLRVLVLAEDAGTAVEQLPAGATVEMAPIPLSERAPHLQVVAAALLRKTAHGMARVMALPDLRLLRWPVYVEMAALGGGHGRTQEEVVRAALEVEREAWLAAGVDGYALSSQLVSAALGAAPTPAPYDQIPMPMPMLSLLVREHLARDVSILEQADPSTALTLLDQMAETVAPAREWMSLVLTQDPDARLPLAAHLVVARWAKPQERPLGGLLMSMGHPLPGQYATVPPVTVLSVSYCRQIFGSWPRKGGAASKGGAAEAETLAQQIWGKIRERVDVILPHQVLALEWLDRESLDAPDDRLARQRLMLLAELDASQPLAAEILEGAVNDLGALLLTEERAAPDPEGVHMVLDEATQHRIRSMGRQLNAIGSRHRKGRRGGSADRLRDAERLLGALAQQHPMVLDATLLGTALDVSRVARTCGRPRVAAAVLLSMLAPLERIPGKHRIPWPRQSALLGLQSLLHHLNDQVRDARQSAVRAVEVSMESEISARGLLAQIVALRMRMLCDVESKTAVVRQKVLQIARSLVELNPEVYPAYLACSLDQATHQVSPAEQQSLRMEAVEHVMSLSQTRPDLVAPFQGLSMNNLGARLHMAGIRGVGTDVTFDAADAFHQQINQGREACVPALAGTFGNLSAMLAVDGQTEHALALVRKSLALYGPHLSQLQSMTALMTLFQQSTPQLLSPVETMQLRANLRDSQVHSQPYFFWHLRLLTAALTTETDPMSPMAWSASAEEDTAMPTGVHVALHNLGVLLGWGGHVSLGVTALRATVELLSKETSAQAHQESAEALACLSALLLDQQKIDEAITAAENAVNIAPAGTGDGRLQGLISLSAALIARGENATARSCAQRAVDVSDGSPDLRVAALHNLAVAAMAAQDPDGAYQASREALRLMVAQSMPPSSPLLLRLHRQAAARTGLPLADAARTMER